ncbi:MAG: hypothetical protein PUB19_02855 [Lachnospiraceae bacterium]|nr:hypothetical protein [Lachnospiraceae bacterium]
MINSKAIKIKSEELEIPFANILSGYALETAVAMVATSSYGKNLWLCNHGDLGIDVYKKRPSLVLVYAYQGEKSLEEFCNVLCDDLWMKYQQVGFLTEKIEQQQTDRGMRIRLELKLEEMYVPLVVEVEQIRSTHLFPWEENYRLLMENNKTVALKLYPIEQMVAHHLAEIIRQLELINDMEHYIELYDILKQYPLEGRKVKDELARLCEKMRISTQEKAFRLWSGYGDYSYMKKKWKVLLRREKRQEPTWEEAFRLIEKFFGPIWQAVCRDEIFFADWMPEIERFLE